MIIEEGLDSVIIKHGHIFPSVFRAHVSELSYREGDVVDGVPRFIQHSPYGLSWWADEYTLPSLNKYQGVSYTNKGLLRDILRGEEEAISRYTFNLTA